MALVLMEVPIKFSEHPGCRPCRHELCKRKRAMSSWGVGGKRPAPHTAHQPAAHRPGSNGETIREREAKVAR